MYVTFDEEPTPEDLEHYGVLGMKWGHHRMRKAQANVRKARANLKSTQKGTKEYNRATTKLRKAEKKAATRKAVYETIYDDAKHRKYVEKQSLGKSIAQEIVFGPAGSAVYSASRANGYGRARSTIGAAVTSSADVMFAGLVSASSTGVATIRSMQARRQANKEFKNKK